MLQNSGTFQWECVQLQDLNTRLSRYLSRVKHLEQENAFLISEINAIRRKNDVESENHHKFKLQGLRRTVNELCFQKSKVETDRERLVREFHMVQALCSQESGLRKDIDGELRACESHLAQIRKTNSALEGRLLHLNNVYKFLEDAHRNETAQLRNQLSRRMLPISPSKHHGSPAIDVDELDEFTWRLSKDRMESFELYCKRITSMEETLKLEKAKLENVRKDNKWYASELNTFSFKLKEQNQLQARLKEHLITMQERFQMELSQYQVIVEELEKERQLLASAISDKITDYQDLMQVKMGLSLELAAYRALLEEGRRDGSVRADQCKIKTSRKIEPKMPPALCTARGTSISHQESGRIWRPINTEFDSTNVEPKSGKKLPHGSTRTVFVTGQRCLPTRRDLQPLTRTVQDTSNIAKCVLPHAAENKAVTQRNIPEGRAIIAENVQHSAEHPVSPQEFNLKVRSNDSPIPVLGVRSVSVISPPAVTQIINAKYKEEENTQITTEKSNPEKENDVNKINVNENETSGRAEINGNMSGRKISTSITKHCLTENQPEGHVSQTDDEWVIKEPYGDKSIPGEGKMLESVSVEETMEKEMKPVDVDAKVGPSSYSEVTHNVKKSNEEDLDILDESVLNEVLNKGVKKFSLEDISLGIIDENVEHKLVNAEITQEPLDAQNEEDSEIKVNPTSFQSGSMFFQNKDLESISEGTRHPNDMHEESSSLTPEGENRETRSVQVKERSGDLDSPFYDKLKETEYFIPDDNISEPDKIPLSYFAHHEVLDSISDERYCQEDSQVKQGFEEDDQCRHLPKNDYMEHRNTFNKHSFPECITEEVQVSPTVRESLLELLKDDSVEQKEQKHVALEQLQEKVCGSLKKELGLFTKKCQESSDNMVMDIRPLQQAQDGRMVTIVRDLNISQSLEASELLKRQGADDISEELLEVLQSSSFQQTIRSVGNVIEEYGDVLKFSKDQTDKISGCKEQEVLTSKEPTNQVNKTEKNVKLGTSERSSAFQTDISNVQAPSSGGETGKVQDLYFQAQKIQDGNSKEITEDTYSHMLAITSKNVGEVPGVGESQQSHQKYRTSYSSESLCFSQLLQPQMKEPYLHIQKEKRIAIIYLQSQEDNEFN